MIYKMPILWEKNNRNTASDPNKIYDTFIEIVLSTKANYSASRRVNFNRHEHRMQKWVPTRIIKSTNTKDKMYIIKFQSRFHCDSLV